ncbi:hypothetical protein KIN20_033275 [Parelaphostrongylus tenuis]|uniref:Uncharacterized protein n=1 Tax=Parelaphostrongylus tenuis TaxID=148309 RepID=A0AAD5R7X2_PARTN|nr:hypothetical protein KIN20_033275 [Parelaphostrongylus tenuis]
MSCGMPASIPPPLTLLKSSPHSNRNTMLAYVKLNVNTCYPAIERHFEKAKALDSSKTELSNGYLKYEQKALSCEKFGCMEDRCFSFATALIEDVFKKQPRSRVTKDLIFQMFTKVQWKVFVQLKRSFLYLSLFNRKDSE